MKVKSCGNWPRTIDGEAIGPFRDGQQYELADDLANKLIDSAIMEKVVPPPVAKKETAALGTAKQQESAEVKAAKKKTAKKKAAK